MNMGLGVTFVRYFSIEVYPQQHKSSKKIRKHLEGLEHLAFGFALVCLTLWRRNFFLILAHPVCKM
jgi:hypothetical protein